MPLQKQRKRVAIPARNDEFRDFRCFLQYGFEETLDGAKPTPLQYDIADAMQTAAWKVVFGVPRPGYGKAAEENHIIIEALRGEGKSVIAIWLGIWCLYWKPKENVLTLSASEGFAGQFSTAMLSNISNLPELQWMMPAEGNRESVLKFDVAGIITQQHPSMKALGIAGQLAGCRGGLIIVDDVETDENSRTDTERAKNLSRMKELAWIRKKPLSATIILGTPHTEESMYNILAKDYGYKRLIWPARYPDHEWIEAVATADKNSQLGPLIAKHIKDDPTLVGPVMRENPPTEPTRFSHIDLLAEEERGGRSAFAMQMLLSTALTDETRHPLKLRDLIVTDFGSEGAPLGLQWSNANEHQFSEVPWLGLPGDRLYRPSIVGGEIGKFENGIMAIDPAGMGKDAMGLCITRLMGGFIFVSYIGGLFGGYGEHNLRKVCMLAQKHGVRTLVPEPNLGDGMYTSLLISAVKKYYPDCSVKEPPRSSGQKECRIIDTLEPLMNQHRVVFSAQALIDEMKPIAGVPAALELPYRFQHQLTRITRERNALGHDDLVEAFSMGVEYWIPHMAVTTEQAQANEHAKSFEERVQEWYKHAGRSSWVDPHKQKIRVGHSPTTANWIQRQRARAVNR